MLIDKKEILLNRIQKNLYDVETSAESAKITGQALNIHQNYVILQKKVTQCQEDQEWI